MHEGEDQQFRAYAVGDCLVEPLADSGRDDAWKLVGVVVEEVADCAERVERIALRGLHLGLREAVEKESR